MSDWLDSSNNANCFKQTYVQGFVDVSGGSIITRGTGGGLVIGGDSSLNGTVYLGNSIFVQSDGKVAPGTADNGATAIYVDASYADVSGGQFFGDVISYDISGNADNGAEVSSVSFPYDASWSQLGVDIDGEAAGDKSGRSVSMINSATYGRVVAIGANGNNSSRGHVRVYQYKQFTLDMSGNYYYTSQMQSSSQTLPLIITENTTTPPSVDSYYWTQLGADIDGETSNDNSGYSVSLIDSSNNDLIVAIGARYNTSQAGHVRIYQYKQYIHADMSNNYHWDNQQQNSSNLTPIIITASSSTEPQDEKYYWTQIGADINGEPDNNSRSGWSVSLIESENYGLTVAIGGDGNTGSYGFVRVYQYKQFTLDMSGNYYYTSQTQSSSQTLPLIITSSTSTPPAVDTYYWTQIGFDIQGSPSPLRSGWSVSLVDSSANGLAIAIGTLSSYTRVYNYRQFTNDMIGNYHYTSQIQNTTTQPLPLIITASSSTEPQDEKYYWTQMGVDFVSDAGFSVSLVDRTTGLTVAIGTTYPIRIGVYQYINSSWNQIGETIFGESSGDNFGSSVSLVDDPFGLFLAGGAILNDGNGNDSGHVRIFQYKAFTSDMDGRYYYTSQIQNTTDQLKPLIITGDTFPAPQDGNYYWTQLGADINGRAINANFGSSVSLVKNTNGLSVAIGGENLASGYVSVYEITETKTYKDTVQYNDVQVIGGYLNDGLTSAALYVNGNTDLSGGLTVSGDVSFNTGNLFVAGDLSLNGNLYINSYAANSINADAIDSTVDINFANKLSVATADLSLNGPTLQVATDFHTDNAPTDLATNLTVPANIAIVDGSNGTVYGSYLTLTNKDATAYYNVGKSVSGIFNIVNQANAGVYLASGGTSFTGTSDARLKTNVAPLESATDKIMALTPCTYQWKSEDPTAKPHVGFIAQEVEQIMPELVHPIDHPAGPDYKGVNTTDMIPYLVRTIQEQNVMIKSLHKEIDILENV